MPREVVPVYRMIHSIAQEYVAILFKSPQMYIRAQYVLNRGVQLIYRQGWATILHYALGN